MPQITVDFTQIFVAVLTVLLPVALAFAHDKLSKLQAATVRQINAHTTAAQRALIESVVRSAVLAAEQTGLTSQLQSAGRQKFQQAVSQVQRELDQYNIKVDFSVIAGLIESSVLQEFNYRKTQPASPNKAAVEVPATPAA